MEFSSSDVARQYRKARDGPAFYLHPRFSRARFYKHNQHHILKYMYKQYLLIRDDIISPHTLNKCVTFSKIRVHVELGPTLQTVIKKIKCRRNLMIMHMFSTYMLTYKRVNFKYISAFIQELQICSHYLLDDLRTNQLYNTNRD